MFKRRLKLILLVITLPFVLLAAFLVFERIRGEISLARVKRVLMGQGEKLTLAELLPKAAPNEDNGATALWQAVGRLTTNGTVVPDNVPPRMRLTASGRAIVSFREYFLFDEGKTNSWQDVREDLSKNEEVLDDIRELLQKPVLRTSIDYSAGPQAYLGHLPKPRTVTRWFGSSLQLALHEGRKDDALVDLLAEVSLPRSLEEDRLLISELVRIAIEAIARTDTWEALQANGWTDRQLEQIQGAWEKERFSENMIQGLEGELIYAQTAFDRMRRSNAETSTNFFVLEEFLPPDEAERPWWERNVRRLPGGEQIARFLKAEVYCRVWRFAWLAQDEARYLDFGKKLLVVAREAAKSKSKLEVTPAIDRLLEKPAMKSFYDRLRFSMSDASASLTGGISRAMHAETERSVILCAVALKRYQVRHQKMPPSLDALVPDIVDSVPVDYMDGRPIRYKPNPDGTFLLYSIGDDFKDDGGSADLRPGKKNLRNLWDRKDFVWPTPATAEEVEQYERMAGKQD